MDSVKEMGKVMRGEAKPSRTWVVEAPDAAAIRGAAGQTQIEFATLLGISVKTLKNWEQGVRTPEGPARVLLQVAALHPDAVRAASASLRQQAGTARTRAKGVAKRSTTAQIRTARTKGRPRKVAV